MARRIDKLAYISQASYKISAVAPRSLNREFSFLLNDVARMLRTYADQKTGRLGITRAQWTVLARLDRFEGLKQSELAGMLDLQRLR